MLLQTFTIHSPFADWSSKEDPVSPFIHLSVTGRSDIDVGSIILSPQLMSNKEIDETVDQLKLDLKSFRESAKLELRKLQIKMLQK